MLSLVSQYLNHGWSNAVWMLNTMDTTQWGIVSVTVVVLGFVALKSR